MTKDDGTWLNLCYMIFGLLVAYVAFKAVETFGLQTGYAERYDDWYPLVNRAIAIGCGLAGGVWMALNPERRQYHLAAIGEVRKVSWPSSEDTKRMTVVVVIVVAIFSVILTIFDVLWSRALQVILP